MTPTPKAKHPHASSVQFVFSKNELKLLNKIAAQYVPKGISGGEKRMAFLHVGRWALANWNKIEPSFVADISYTHTEGVPWFEFVESKIQLQSNLFGRIK